MQKTTQTPTMIPYLTVRHAQDALRFYQDAFGFAWINASEADAEGNIEHVEMQYRDVLIMFAPEGAFGNQAKAPVTLGITMPLTLYLYCDDVDALYQRTLQAGARSLMEPQDSSWGDRFFKVADPDGFEWMFAQSLKK